LKYLRYFLYGPDLPHQVTEAFRQKITDIGFVTSSDIVPLGVFARQLTRTNSLDAVDPAEEFFKLALDCGLELYEARSIRDSVKAAASNTSHGALLFPLVAPDAERQGYSPLPIAALITPALLAPHRERQIDYSGAGKLQQPQCPSREILPVN